MLVRIVLFLGLSLILFAGGAVGWQYWQGLAGGDTAAAPPATPAPATSGDPAATSGAPVLGLIGQIEPVSAPAQNWLISPGGELVDCRSLRQWLRQDSLVEGREIHLSFTAPMADLLSPGEALPAPVYRQVFADIRAPVLARGLCEIVVKDGSVAACAFHSARVPDGGVSEDGATVEVSVSLAYALTAEAEPLPDLAAHVLHEDYLYLPGSGPEAFSAATPQELVAVALAELPKACPQEAASHCRLLGMNLRWKGPGNVDATGRIAWLAPMPQGMYPAPPLEAAPEAE